MSFGHKNKIFLIFKKELDRFFGDRRMVISALILPGVLLYFVYAFLAPNMVDLIMGGGTKSTVYSINTPAVIQTIFEHAGINLVPASYNEKDNILDGISQMNGNFLLIFPPNFEEEIAIFEVASGENAPEIRLHYNSLSEGFLQTFAAINAILNAYERSIARKFEINASGGGDMADASEIGRNFFASILPMFLLVFIYHAAIASVTESITGEKERGTLSTILITPITPMELATGKIFGLSVLSFLCGISGTLGILLSLPRFIESLNAQLLAEQDFSSFLTLGAININQYGILDILALITVLLSCALFIVTLIAIVSIHAKTAKEAQLVLSPMIIIIMLISLISALGNNDQRDIFHYFIPIYNSVQSIDDIFNQSYITLQIFLTVFSNILFAAIGTLFLSRLFKSEKIISAS